MDAMKAARILFAATMVAIGIFGIVSGSFAPIWQPVPEAMPARLALSYLCSLVAVLTGAGLLARRSARSAALVLLIYLAVWTLAFKGVTLVRHPLVEVVYQSIGENAVLIAAAWMLFDRSGPRLAQIVYGLALVAFGLSHFFYLDLTAPLVPAWLPAPVAWAYLTGAIYLATGISLLSGFAMRAGAMIAAAQITLITVLVWGPMVLAGNVSAEHWQEKIVSWALTAAAWVIAASFEGRPWLARPARLA